MPADLRLVEAAQLRVEEAALTGESQPVEKTTAALAAHALALGDQRNMAFKGTAGQLRPRHAAWWWRPGCATELGRIAALLRDEREVRTPLQRRLARFGARLAVAVVVICAVIFGIGMLRGGAPAADVLTALSLRWPPSPRRCPRWSPFPWPWAHAGMVRQNALIRRLPAVETLGSVTVICSDKTGTLTRTACGWTADRRRRRGSVGPRATRRCWRRWR